MAYYFDHLLNLKPLNPQFRQEIKIFYSIKAGYNLNMALSWFLNYSTAYTFSCSLQDELSVLREKNIAEHLFFISISDAEGTRKPYWNFKFSIKEIRKSGVNLNTEN